MDMCDYGCGTNQTIFLKMARNVVLQNIEVVHTNLLELVNCALVNATLKKLKEKCPKKEKENIMAVHLGTRD